MVARPPLIDFLLRLHFPGLVAAASRFSTTITAHGVTAGSDTAPSAAMGSRLDRTEDQDR